MQIRGSAAAASRQQAHGIQRIRAADGTIQVGLKIQACAEQIAVHGHIHSGFARVRRPLLLGGFELLEVRNAQVPLGGGVVLPLVQVHSRLPTPAFDLSQRSGDSSVPGTDREFGDLAVDGAQADEADVRDGLPLLQWLGE